MNPYFGLYKPKDWYLSVFPVVNSLSNESEKLYHALKIVRFELPFFRKDFPVLFQAIHEKNKPQLMQIASTLFGTENCKNLQFIPAPSHPSNQSNLEIAYIRIMVENSHVNKGVGLKNLIHSLNIPESHVICFGDSAGETASDALIKSILPESTLFITDNGDSHAIECADFLIKNVSENGVPQAIEMLMSSI